MQSQISKSSSNQAYVFHNLYYIETKTKQAKADRQTKSERVDYGGIPFLIPSLISEIKAQYFH